MKVKKILSIMIIIIVIFSININATNVSIPDNNNEVNSGSEEKNEQESETDKKEDNEQKEEVDNKEDSKEENKTDTNNNNNGNSNNSNNNTNKNPNKGNGTNNSSKNNNTTETATKPVTTKSSNADLKTLKTNIEGLTPDFDKDTTEYYLVVDLSIKKVQVTATTEDKKAKTLITGGKSLKEGENTITIKVTAEDGTVKNYYIYVTRTDNKEKANANLKGLEIEGYNVYPSFKTEIYNYNLTIEEKINKLDIVAKPENEKATIEVTGNENLVEGDNIIKILVTAEDGTTTRTYKINTYLSSKIVEVKKENKMPAIIAIGILGIGIIALSVVVVRKNK